MSIKAILSFVAGLFLSFTIHASEIDKRLVGVWEGQRDENGKCPFMAWEFKRFENGRFEVMFFRNRSKIRNLLNTETGTWTTEGSKYILNTDDVPNPDAYIYNVIDNDTVEFTNIQRDPSADCAEDYKFVDRRADKPLIDNSFKTDEFNESPIIPVNTNISRYIGKWADQKNKVVQIEIRMDPAGNAVLFHESNENWNYLYNDVRWEGDELHYQNFAYSTKPSLFTHPFHKSMHRSILAPLEDANRIKRSFFIGNKRFDSILIKVE